MAEPDEVSKARRSRAGAAAWLSRARRECEELLEVLEDDSARVSLVQYTTVIENFSKRMLAWEKAETLLEESIDIDQLEEEIDTAATFKAECDKARVSLDVKWNEIRQATANTAREDDFESAMSLVSVTGSSVSPRIKLPKLELPRFGGECTMWSTFWEQFDVSVNSSELPEVSKFTYLRSLLFGEAKACVDGLSLTAANYHAALDLLKRRYGRKDLIVYSHIQALLNVQCEEKTLRCFLDKVLTHIRSLEAMGIVGEQYGVFLTPVIVSRLPASVRLEWARDSSEREADIQWLLDFLRKEIERRERSAAFTETSLHSHQPKASYKPKNSAAALAIGKLNSTNCGFCGNVHLPWKCDKVKHMTVEERLKKIKDSGMCFRCLSRQHKARSCDYLCKRCNGEHNVLCCTKVHTNVAHANRATVSNGSSATFDHVSPASISHVGTVVSPGQKSTVLQTAKVTVMGRGGGHVTANLLFDTGSDYSYVSTSLVKRVDPLYVRSQQVAYTSFGQRRGNNVTRNVYMFDILTCSSVTGGSGTRQSISAIEVPVISAPMLRKAVPTHFLENIDVSWADNFSSDRNVEIDILIGQDFYWSFFISGKSIQLGQGLVAQDTSVGWVVSGAWSGDGLGTNPNVALLCLTDISRESLKNFWDLESIGISAEDRTVADPVMERFTENVKIVDGRYEVSLPWKEHFGSDQLLDNVVMAKGRLDSLSRKLHKDTGLLESYNGALMEMEVNGVIVEVSEEEHKVPHPTFYLPHRPVVKSSSLTTKVRPVFDASAGGPNGVSLNDCLESGPNLLPNLLQILIRFRRWPVALIADIEKAFLQLRVARKDQDVHRFLWDFGGRTRIMRFVRLPFGNKSSPFLLNATIKHHLDCYSKFGEVQTDSVCSKAISELRDNMYVDDWLSGADSERDACELFSAAYSIMKEANLPLTKLGSNNKELCQVMWTQYDSKYQDVDCHKVLGLKWISSEDCFLLDGLSGVSDLIITKRVVLSYIARFYDPLGFATPVLVTAKLIFQDVWKLDLGWDVEIPPELGRVFSEWIAGLDLLCDLKVLRCYSKSPWGELTGLELHGFGDASERCYGTAVYLKCYRSDGLVTVSLVMSKAKIAPIKKVSLPRLELLGALLTARLMCFVKEALVLPADTKLFYWTDSMITLGWIQGSPDRWKPFVGNRVSEIQSRTNAKMWSHCPGKENPADLLTRGLSAKDLVASKLWLYGPDFLYDGSKYPVVGEFSMPGMCDLPEVRVTAMVAPAHIGSVVSADSHVSVFPFERWSSLVKVIRIFGYVYRFINNIKSLKAVRCSGDLSDEEVAHAKVALIKYLQSIHYGAEIEHLRSNGKVSKSSSIYSLWPFLDDQGLLRVKGRLEFADLSYDEKHPLIIPKSHVSRLMVEFQHKLLKHAGVDAMVSSLRANYWIVGVRRIAKSVKGSCFNCRKLDAPACGQVAAQLPALRVTKAPPFSVCGVDFAGPLYTSDSPRKFYILLFTCAVVRAVHLELVDSLSVRDFLLAFKRFVSRRGLPSVVYSDNAKTFVSAKSELVKLFGLGAPQWRFIVPRSPWWGGWWERMVRSIKSSLKRTLGKGLLSKVELETSLVEVEGGVNSRPLTFVGADVEECRSLTPCHFLIGRRSYFSPVGSDSKSFEVESVCSNDLIAAHALMEQRLDQFWTVWQSDYLRNLPPLVRGFTGKGNFDVGTLVLIREDNCTRLMWPMGVITKVFPGRDGLVRSVELKTAKGLLCRPIQRLHCLEMGNGLVGPVVVDAETQGSSEISESPTSTDYVTKRGRVSRPVQRLDL